MPSTPPPPGRVHTPPTPLHGARFDSWEPYSPRRSSRVASKRTVHSHSPNDIAVPKHRSARALTPPNPKQSSLTRTSSQTFSPPSSPASPAAHSVKRSNGHRRASPGPQSGSDTDILPSTSTRLKASSADSFGMLQTPAKTPRKRTVPNAGSNGTARSLFVRPMSIDDAMPSPRKARKAKYFNPFSIAEEGDDEASSKKIQIYTDTKERVPSLDEDASNPFLSKNAAKPSRRQKRSQTNLDSTMEEAVKNDEGVVYVFRGKKILRKFEDGDDEAAVGSDDNLSDLEVRRRAGVDASRPFTRSSIKPRLLFPSEAQRQAREAADEADEEAETDIEEPPRSSPSKKRNGKALEPVEHPEPESLTPVKSRFEPTTPPSTERVKRASARKDVTWETATTTSASAQLEHVTSGPSTSSGSRPKSKPSPFDGWARAKSGTGAKGVSKGTKREGEALTGEGAKRTRSGAYSGSV